MKLITLDNLKNFYSNIKTLLNNKIDIPEGGGVY